MSSLPSSPPPIARRKRRRFSEALPSSDPVFSSDDLQDASVEQYDAPRQHKKKYRGSWWLPGSSQEGAGTSKLLKTRGQFERKMDSGIWMGSDEVEADEDMIGVGLVDGAPKCNLPDANLPLRGKPVVEDESKNASRNGHGLSKEENWAQVIVEKALENCSDRVDLSGLGLRHISGSTLMPLNSLTRKPRAMYSPPVDDAYEDLRPQLQLYLSWNSLQSLPPELWGLEHLTVLSLRNNELTEISPSIARLRNLVELNLAGNKFQLLPWELLSFSKKDLKRLAVHPNPSLLQGIRPGNSLVCKIFQDSNKEILELPKSLQHLDEKCSSLESAIADGLEDDPKQQATWLLRVLQTLRRRMLGDEEDGAFDSPQRRNMAPIFVASSPITYLAIDGTPFPNDSGNQYSAPQRGKALSMEDSATSSQVPSLLELSLRSANQYFKPDEMLPYLPDPMPVPLQRSLSLARSAPSESTVHNACRSCTVCGRAYIIPRAEWVEYWHWGKATFKMWKGQKSLPHAFRMEEMFLPFQRKACSWGCAELAWNKNAEGIEIEM